MCRLAAFPPFFPRNDAIDILKNFENNNTDGTGAVWVEGKKFVVEKYPKALTKVLRKHRFLAHMPHNGWTLAHLRAASHGDKSFVNTHPFVAGKFAVCHNGTFDEFKIVKLALGNRVQFDGETDSEAAAHLISVAGPKRFSETVDFSGVFLVLNIRGDLWAIKTSGDLEIQALPKDEVVLCSKFDPKKFPDSEEAQIGWYHLDKEGKYIKHKKVREGTVTYHNPSPECGQFGMSQGPPYANQGNQSYHIPHDPDRRSEHGIIWPYKGFSE
jgi:predicted glutamine amidotransferase